MNVFRENLSILLIAISRTLNITNDSGLNFLLKDCFYHNPCSGKSNRLAQLARATFSFFIFIQQLVNLLFVDEKWTWMTGNFEGKNNIQGIWRWYAVSVTSFYTILLFVFFWTSKWDSYAALMKIVTEIMDDPFGAPACHAPKKRTLRLTDDRRRYVLKIINRLVIFIRISLGIFRIMYLKNQLISCWNFYGWSPSLLVGLSWVVAVNLWMKHFMEGGIGTVVMVFVVNMTFCSWINQEVEDIEKIESRKDMEEKLFDAIHLLGNLRRTMKVVTYYFTVIVVRPVVVLGFMFGSLLLAMMKGQSASAVTLLLSSGVNLALWFVILMGSSAFLDSKQKGYVKKLTGLVNKKMGRSGIRHWTIVGGSRQKNSFTLLGHDVTSRLFLMFAIETVMNVMLVISLLKDTL